MWAFGVFNILFRVGFEDHILSIKLFATTDLDHCGLVRGFLQFDDGDILSFILPHGDLENDGVCVSLLMIHYSDVIHFAIAIQVQVVHLFVL